MTRTQIIDHSIVKEQVLGSLFDRYNRMCIQVGKCFFKDVCFQVWDRRDFKRYCASGSTKDECSKSSTESPNLLEAFEMDIKLVRLEQILRAYSVAGDSETYTRGIADCP